VVFAGYRTDLALLYRALVEIVTNGETGRLVRKDSPAASGAALVGALADPARHLGWDARAREEALQRIRFDHQVAGIQTMCKAALEAPGAP
jgi:hypothetical protein